MSQAEIRKASEAGADNDPDGSTARQQGLHGYER